MAFLSGTFLGFSPLLQQGVIPSPISYTKCTLLGGQSIFDKIHIQNIALTNEQIRVIDPTQEISWLPSTLLLAEFSADTLDGGNVIALPSALVGWKIYRRDMDTNISTLIATVPAGTSTYTDYEVGAYKNYVFEIFPYTSSALGSPLITSEIYSDFFGWYLLDFSSPSSYPVYKFDLNLVSGQIENETNVVVYDTYTQKPVVAQGQRDYIKGNISCIAGDVLVNNTLYQPSSYLNDLRSFINNGRSKVLKSRKGHVWKIITFGMPMKFMDEVGEQVTNISFNFNEIA